MSSKRGRKRNDTLPPNRARDVQRAFRARRALHLQQLEDRVAELEEENESFRVALNLPPAHRPPLGKGPTGKDKSKSAYGRSSLPPMSDLSAREDTPSSPPTSSSSPQSGSFSLGSMSNSADGVNRVAWEPALVLQHDDQTEEGSPGTQFPFGQHPQSTTRSSAELFMPHSAVQNYSHSNDRPMAFPREESQFSFHTPLNGSPASHMRSLAANAQQQQSPVNGGLDPPQGLVYPTRRFVT
ncbi:hypothetical protein BD410DRAFT_717752 [Rickenella mellea]|uniref:BZIP domain-containing protein n=1 Tax=Rickenella mellea TaxID=50990 RepID=A0A4Y7QEJ4_9AGAM|nr:hypothetical protein BD410DRAFT_717752 [Rickenella mellea]